MQPPGKPIRPQPNARGLPQARQDIVPGVPKQAPSPRALEAAREASRSSNPEIQDVKIDALTHRVVILENRLDDVHDNHGEVVKAVQGLVTKVSGWELAAAGSEGVKVQEEQKTKRWMALIGLLTMVIAPLLTVTVNYLSRDTPPPAAPVLESAMKLELDACAKAPSDQAWAECIRDAALRNAPTRQR